MIDQFPWAMRFTNIDVNKKVNLFNKTVKNVILNSIPYETISGDYRDPPWINKNIKEQIREKTKLTSHIAKIKTTHFLFISSKFFNQG